MIQNSLKELDILNTVRQFGYPGETLLEGKELLERFESLSAARLMALGEKKQAAKDAADAWKKARRVYSLALQVARIAFGGDIKASASLMLSGPRKRDYPSWAEQAGAFYSNLLNNPELLAGISRFGWNEEKIRAEYDVMREADRKKTAQRNMTGEAMKATEVRDACFDELAKWVSDYRKILRIAFADDLQKLEKLGIKVKSKR